MSADLAKAPAKLLDLRSILRRVADAVVVAFSGGVDSSLLAVVAHQELRGGMLAAIADSPSLPRRELDAAIALARQHDVPLEVVVTKELQDPRYGVNDPDRCAYCKEALVEAVSSHPRVQGRTLLLGVNVDDLQDHRPGQDAARRRGARFPLVESGLGKREVRFLARELRIETWDKPAAACLASRLAYRVPVTAEALRRVERAEEALRRLGFAGDVRVRDQGNDLARIEVPKNFLDEVVSRRTEVVDALREAGFRYVTLDLEGFRSGSQNIMISLKRTPPT